MAKRIEIVGWAAKNIELPKFAVGDPEESLEAIKKAISRKNGLLCVAQSSQGTRLENGKCVANHYQLQFGRKVDQRYGEGFSVEGSCWVEIPIQPRSEDWENLQDSHDINNL